MNENEKRLMIAFMVYCTLTIGIVAFTKYKLAKLDWANARAIAELAKEASK